MSNKKKSLKVLLLAAMMLVWLCGIPVSAEGASGDNSLSTLGILTEGVEVSPEFYYSTIEYNVKVPAGTAKLELEPVTSNPNASIVNITGQELVDGKTTVEIRVAAENGSEYSYYLYVEEDPSQTAPTAQTEPETEKMTETEKETEPETEDPRYVRVDRNSLQEAENTISTLKAETSNYRNRLGILMKILYGLIGFCVILLFVVINLILKKKDLKAELQNYMGYGYGPQDNDMQQSGAPYQGEYGYGDYTYDGQSTDQMMGYGPQGGYADQNGYGPQDGYTDQNGYGPQDGYTDQNGYGPQDGYTDQNGYGPQEGYANDGSDAGRDDVQQARSAKQAKKEKKSRRSNDDPNTVPKPAKAKKKAKQMPEYQKPQKPAEYQPNGEKASENVEINMIDL